MLLFRKKAEMPNPAAALPGRADPLPTAERHFVSGIPLKEPYPEDSESIVLGLGCFWGAERKFWQVPKGVVVTAVGYAGGYTLNPTYEEVCSGLTGHNEVVLVVFDTKTTSLADILKIFFESHNPTQGFRQGNDVGTQYRSGIYTTDLQQAETARAVRTAYGEALAREGYGAITTEIEPLTQFYFAEEYHQQYLAKNPSGYCGLGGTGVSCPAGVSVAAE